MPVHEELPYSEATGNGVTTQFPLGFTCDHKIFLKVRVNDSYVNDDLWSLDKDTVTFKTAPGTDSYIQFKRETKIERTIDYATYNDSLRGEILNNDFDTVYKILQETKADTNQYKPDYEYSVSKANEAFSCAQEAKTSAEEALQISNMTRTIEQGGTGASTAEKARENLDVHSKGEVLTLIQTGGTDSIIQEKNGGTGADNFADARKNLDVLSTDEAQAKFASLNENSFKGSQIIEKDLEVVGTFQADIKPLLNAEGSPPISALRAWLTLKGTDEMSLLAYSNILALTDNELGDYTIYFDKPMPHENYAVLFGYCDSNGALSVPKVLLDPATNQPILKTVSEVRISIGIADMVSDVPFLYMGVVC
jgi:hypothetical protein